MASQTVGVVITATATVVCGTTSALLLVRGDRFAASNNRTFPGVRAQPVTMRFLGWFLAVLTVALLVTVIVGLALH